MNATNNPLHFSAILTNQNGTNATNKAVSVIVYLIDTGEKLSFGPAVEIGGGLYKYTLIPNLNKVQGDYVAVFTCSDPSLIVSPIGALKEVKQNSLIVELWSALGGNIPPSIFVDDYVRTVPEPPAGQFVRFSVWGMGSSDITSAVRAYDLLPVEAFDAGTAGTHTQRMRFAFVAGGSYAQDYDGINPSGYFLVSWHYASANGYIGTESLRTVVKMSRRLR
jgi:hypothetical protein